MNGNCRIKECTRHELWGGLCRDHLVEALYVQHLGDGKTGNEAKAEAKKAVARKKKIDAVEVVTADADTNEERIDDDK